MGSSACLPCNANATSPAAARSIKECVCSPGWFGAPGVSCTRCPANSYQPAQNKTACIPCQVPS
jgi:hypothetical protein